jgi:hypothetical protein
MCVNSRYDPDDNRVRYGVIATATVVFVLSFIGVVFGGLWLTRQPQDELTARWVL